MRLYSEGFWWCAKCQRRVLEEETYVSRSEKRVARHHIPCGCTVRFRGRSGKNLPVRKNVIEEGVSF